MNTIGTCNCGFEGGWEFQANFRFPEGTKRFASPVSVFDTSNCRHLPPGELTVWEQGRFFSPDPTDPRNGQLIDPGYLNGAIYNDLYLGLSTFKNAYVLLTRKLKALSQVTMEISLSAYGE